MESLLSAVYISTLYYWLMCPVGVEATADFPLLEGLRSRIALVVDGIGAKGGRP